MREGPGTNYKAIGFFRRNDTVEGIELNADGSWLRVRRLSDNLTGWVSSSYLVRITPPNPPPPTDGDSYRVTASSLYVREGPGTNYKSVGYLVRNDIVQALEFNADQSWMRVVRPTDGLTGWCSSTYLEKVSTGPTPPPSDGGERYRVTASKLNIREGPGTNYAAIGYAEFNEIVTGIDVNADKTWRKIRKADGLEGWASASYLFLIPTTPGDPNAGEGAGDWYRSTASQLNVREGPDATSKSLGYLSKDEVVEALEVNADKTWIRFRKVDGLLGWSSAQYLINVGNHPDQAMQKIFNGVTYYRTEKTSPHSLVAHVLVVDLQSKGADFLVTPPSRDTLPYLCTSKTSQFLKERGMQVAINGDGFYYLDPTQYSPADYCPNGGDPIRLVGYAASRGKEYSEKAPGRPILYLNKKNGYSFDDPRNKVYNAISGDLMLVKGGKKVAGLDTQEMQPRTAIGFNRNGRWAYFVVADGRESTSDGATYSDLADILLSYGAFDAVAFDGGGSSTMVIEGIDGNPRIVNNVIDDNVPGNERAVANHLGFTLKK